MFLITLLTKCMEQFFDLYQNKDLTFFLHRISYIIYGNIWPDSTTVWFKKSEFCIFDSFFEFPIQFWPRKMVWHSMISSSEKWHIRYLVRQNCPWRLEMCLRQHIAGDNTGCRSHATLYSEINNINKNNYADVRAYWFLTTGCLAH